MRRKIFTIFGISVMVFLFSMAVPLQSGAEVSVHISIPLPGLVFPAPPPMVAVPGTYVYYPADANAEIFFYNGYWYRPYRGQWFIALGYNGPWGFIAAERVPYTLYRIPSDYRHPYGHSFVPPGHYKRASWSWEGYGGKDRGQQFRGKSENKVRGQGRGQGQGKGPLQRS